MKKAFTLIELMVAIAIIGMLVAALMISSKAIVKSYSDTCTDGVLDSLLANARQTALKSNTYAGIRFQRDSSGKQYAVLIQADTNNLEIADSHGVLRTAVVMRPVIGVKPVCLGDRTALVSTAVIQNRRIYPHDFTNTLMFSPDGQICQQYHVVHGHANDNWFNPQGHPFANETTQALESQLEIIRIDVQQWQAAQKANQENPFCKSLKSTYINVYTGTLILP